MEISQTEDDLSIHSNEPAPLRPALEEDRGNFRRNIGSSLVHLDGMFPVLDSSAYFVESRSYLIPFYGSRLWFAAVAMKKFRRESIKPEPSHTGQVYG
jgi:hypothetical protein